MVSQSFRLILVDGRLPFLYFLYVVFGDVGGVDSYPLSSQAPTQVVVDMGCDNWPEIV
jgi:hypothetical protein